MLKRACLFCLLSCAVLMMGEVWTTRALPSSGPLNPPDAHAKWNALVDEYFEQAYFKFNPTAGTSAGLHQYDPVLEEYSRAAVDRQIHTLHIFEERVAAFDVSSLDQTEAADQQLVSSNILGTLLTLETIRPWEKNPDIYSSGIAASAFTIMSRRFAPPDDRLRSLIARERQMPAVFAAALDNLNNPPRIYTQIAIEQLPGIISFFQKDVPAAFADATDAALQADFVKSNTTVIAALEGYQTLAQDRLCFRARRAISASARTPSRKNSNSTKWWICPRSTARHRLGRFAQESGALQRHGQGN